MSLPSGVKRFMLWDFRKNTILVSGWLVMAVGSIHGRAYGLR